MNEHAKIAPSGLRRVVNCPGSLVLCATVPYPSKDNEEADEGIRAHAIAASILTGNSENVDDDIMQHINEYVNYVKSRVGVNNQLIVERKVQIPYFHSTDCWGTPDAVVIGECSIDVIDFKYGFKWVTDYTQLIAYAVGVIQTYNVNPQKIRLTYVQPRARHPDGPIRTLTLTPEELRKQAEYIKQRIDLALQTVDPPLISGPHCYRCPRQYDCSANTHAAANVIDSVTDITNTVDSNIVSLERELEALHRAQDLLKERVINIEQVLTYRINNGERSNIFEIKMSSGNRKFIVDEKHVVLECELEGIDPYEKILKSPAKLEKEGLPKETTRRITQVPKTAKLSKVNFDHVKKVFKL